MIEKLNEKLEKKKQGLSASLCVICMKREKCKRAGHGTITCQDVKRV